MSLKGKVVLITGSSSGIGRACAEAFAKEGSFLVITGRNEKALEDTKESCFKLGAAKKNVHIFVGDLLKDEDCKSLVEATIKKFGKLDVLVNNAGAAIFGSIKSICMEDYDRQLNVTTRSPFLMTKLSLPHLLKTKGNIVNVSSLTGLRAFSGIVAYCMSKAALDQLTRCVSLEVADRGVRVNSVNPGVILTEFQQRAGLDDEAYRKFLERAKTTHAMGRVGEAHEVAEAVIFLASDQSSFVTGVTLPVDGGKSVMCPR